MPCPHSPLVCEDGSDGRCTATVVVLVVVVVAWIHLRLLYRTAAARVQSWRARLRSR